MDFTTGKKAQKYYNAGTQMLAKLNQSSSHKRDYIRTINYLQKAVELDPNSAYSFHNLSHAWYKFAENEYFLILNNNQFKNLKDYENAVKVATEKGEDKLSMERLRQKYIGEQGKFGLISGYFVFALQAADRALEIQFNFPQAHNTRAMILAKLNRPDEALEAAEFAISQAPDYKNAIDNREKIKKLIKE